ncbi:MAG: hypothetical protein EPN98_19020 [Phenylobacterium sp.]|uniref:hypothetical protein n=1 Tax=Phenylobacterium sp. TaxID=1871053 RepID=UPI001216B3BF|nr:hypothetical protein [Phenylobacterium sp.]TAL29887.1 MAG: hypothetical protein EPN98_19020 [Phenylobacterium sp.]
MDTVGALNRYRMKLAGDPLSFEIMHHIYLDDVVSESKLIETTKAERFSVKKAVRSLFQSNLIFVDHAGNFGLTALGELLICEFGADKVVGPTVLGQIASNKEFEHVNELMQFCHSLEPIYARWTTASFKNVRTYLDRVPHMSEQDRVMLVWSSAIHPDSKARLLLKNTKLSDSDLNTLVVHAGARRSEFSADFTLWRSAAELWDRSDALLVASCAREEAVHASASVELHLSALRVLNYTTTVSRDHLLEVCVKSSAGAAERLVEGVVNTVIPGSATLFGLFRKILTLWPDISRSLRVADIANAIALIVDRKATSAAGIDDELAISRSRYAMRSLLSDDSATVEHDVIGELKRLKDRLADRPLSVATRTEMLAALSDLEKLADLHSDSKDQ